MKIIAAIPTFNRLELLKKVIHSLRNQTLQLSEIIIVNNSSTDGTKDWLLQQSDIIYFEQENLGSSGGQWKAVSLAYEKDADWIWIMDDDVVPELDCLEKLIYALNINKFNENVILVPLRYTPEGEVFLNDATKYNLTNPFASFWTSLLKNEDLENEIINCEGPTFEGPLFHRSLVNAIGLPDKEFFIYGDDTDYFIRAMKAGFKSIIVKSAKMQRKLEYPDDINSKFGWKHYYIIRNIFILDVKHSKPIVKLIRPIIYFIKWLVRAKNFKNMKIVFKSFKDGYLKRILKKN